MKVQNKVIVDTGGEEGWKLRSATQNLLRRQIAVLFYKTVKNGNASQKSLPFMITAFFGFTPTKRLSAPSLVNTFSLPFAH